MSKTRSFVGLRALRSLVSDSMAIDMGSARRDGRRGISGHSAKVHRIAQEVLTTMADLPAEVSGDIYASGIRDFATVRGLSQMFDEPLMLRRVASTKPHLLRDYEATVFEGRHCSYRRTHHINALDVATIPTLYSCFEREYAELTRERSARKDSLAVMLPIFLY